MDEKGFWEIIEKARVSDDFVRHNESYRNQLSELSDSELIDFKMTHIYLKSLARTRELSEAAYVVNNGCGDDDFENFVAGLIAQGKPIFYECLSNPEQILLRLKNATTLVDFGSFDSTPDNIYATRHGRNSSEPLISIASTKLQEILRSKSSCLETKLSCDPSMDGYSEDPDHLKREFPLLFEKYWGIS